MKRTITRLALVAALVAGLGLSTSPAGALGADAGASAPKYCTSFGEYYQVNFAIALVTGFAKAFAGEGQELSADEARNVALLLLSPKLEPLTADLAKKAPRSIRKLFALQADVYGKGVDLLRGLGLTDAQLDDIANSDLTSPTGDSQDFTDAFGITKQDVTDAAAKLGKEIDKAKGSVEPTARQRKALDKLTVDCGTTPDGNVDCDKLFPKDEVQALIGEIDKSGDSCQWEAVEPETGLTPKLAVNVFRSPGTFDQRKETYADRATDVTGVGDKAFIAAGFTSQTSGSTCGKTIVVLSGGDTVIVSLCPPGDTDPTDDQMVQLATDVLDRLPDAGG